MLLSFHILYLTTPVLVAVIRAFPSLSDAIERASVSVWKTGSCCWLFGLDCHGRSHKETRQHWNAELFILFYGNIWLKIRFLHLKLDTCLYQFHFHPVFISFSFLGQ